ncbi:Rho GTPase activation protein [Zychaea mexicana]|uniref:Rho GTPase activation protein n=1 Tax=Zychaea mexicana TaxID=64656 RepID=UPI0022FF037D|nr:Rho GTPase activation protein [Zychaea mexicana]KAI9498351.1 Rho GTPase activation protein [Zychaea mexicana]
MSRPLPLSPQSPEFKGISALNIIYEAGLDKESRPILVLSACNLPNPDTINYDLILAFILARLDEFVENDYVLVFFSSPAQYRPPWMWLLKAYRALDRKYKKNLKALYVLHLNRTYRIIFDLANKITSPKFARKLHYLSTLQEMFGTVTLSSKFIPKQVIDFDTNLPPMQPASRWGSSQQLPIPTDPRKRPLPSLAFGVTLENLARLEDSEQQAAYIPKLVKQIVEHLKANGLEKEGLFRKSPASDELHRVKETFNRGDTVDLTQHDINVSASLLKVFFKELPDPLISPQLCTDTGKLPDVEGISDGDIQRVRDILKKAYDGKSKEYNLLRYLFAFLNTVVSKADKNRMTSHNLAVVFTPNLIRDSTTQPANVPIPATQQEAMANAALYMKQMNEGMGLVQLLISHNERIFG